MQYAKGAIGARWVASDDNGDTLIYTVEIRGVNETAWKLLKDKVKEKYISWDSTAFPDGEYRLRSKPNPGKSDRTYVPEQIITLAPGASRDVTFVYP